MYYKKDGIVIKSLTPVVSLEPSSIKYVTDEGVKVVPTQESFNDVVSEKGLITNVQYWSHATEIEYLTYMSTKLNFELSATRDVRSKLWALNNASLEGLRTGVLYPQDNFPIDIIGVEDKFTIIRQTQHWYKEDRPLIDNVSNANLSRWIVTTRSQEPFVYIGVTY
jgi:hypothetical protein